MSYKSQLVYTFQQWMRDDNGNWWKQPIQNVTHWAKSNRNARVLWPQRILTLSRIFILFFFFSTQTPSYRCPFFSLNQKKLYFNRHCTVVVFAGADQLFDASDVVKMKQNAFTALFFLSLTPLLLCPVIQFSFCFISRYVITCLKRPT